MRFSPSNSSGGPPADITRQWPFSKHGPSQDLTGPGQVIESAIMGNARCTCTLGPADYPSLTPGFSPHFEDFSPEMICCYTLAFKVNFPANVISKSGLPITQASLHMNPSCEDIPWADTSPQYLDTGKQLQMAWVLMGAASVFPDFSQCPDGCPVTFICRDSLCQLPSCTDLAPYCHDTSERGIRARQLCANTCGCAYQHTSLLLSGPLYGCSPACNTARMIALQSEPCTDVSTTDPAMQTYISELRKVAEQWPSSLRSQARQYAKQLENSGCRIATANRAWYADYYNISTSEAVRYRGWSCGATTSDGVIGPFGSSIKPLYDLCPVACACTDPLSPYEPLCPQQCQA